MSLRGKVSSPAARMSSVQALKKFIDERLTAAAAKIFTVFEQTIVQYEEEIQRQQGLLEIRCKHQLKSHETESPQQHNGIQKTSSSLEEEEHEAPHIKEEEDLVVVTVTDGESDNFHNSERDLTTQLLTTVAVEIFTMFEQTTVQYEKEIDRQRRLLEISWESQIKFHRTELPQHHDCPEEQLFIQEAGNYCLQRGEPEPPQIKEEPEEPEPQQIKYEEPGTSQEGERLILKFESEIPSTEEQSYLSEPEEASNTEQFLSHDSRQNSRTFTDKKNICEVCGKGYDRPSELLCHVRTHTGEKPYSCEICLKSYNRQSGLLRHMRTHTGEKPYSCEICLKCYNQRSVLLRHMRTHTGEKPYSCEICGKSFSLQSTLSGHLRTHTGEKPYSCETCGRSFTQHSNLLVHMRSHTHEKPYSCETCGRCFSQQNHLVVHMRTHTGEKPYSCETCGKSFSLHSTLLGHMRTHTGERPYSCETCGKSFTQHSNLMGHMRTHTGEKPYSCETCGKSFSLHSTLLGHTNIHR